MFAASGAFLLGLIGAILSVAVAVLLRKYRMPVWPLAIIFLAFALLGVWGWTR